MVINNTVVDQVWNFLDQNPSVRVSLSQKIINIRALAKYILNKEKIDTTIDGVISAIRRYDITDDEQIFIRARKFIHRTTTISTKSRLVSISLVKDITVQKEFSNLFSSIKYNKGDVLRILQANESIQILIDEKNFESVYSIFSPKEILKVNGNLAEISIHMHPDSWAVPGILAISTYNLAINKINVLEIMSCFPECLLFVDEKDLLKAYHILYRLWQ